MVSVTTLLSTVIITKKKNPLINKPKTNKKMHAIKKLLIL